MRVRVFFRPLPFAASALAFAAFFSPFPSSAKPPLVFEPNLGQAPPAARFVSRGAGYAFLWSGDGATLSLNGSRVRLRLLDANPRPTATAIDPQPGHSNYFLGSDPTAWKRNIPHYRRLRIAEVYPGIDLVYYGNDGRLEFDFLVSPGADPSRIRFALESPNGRLKLDSHGDLLLSTPSGEFRQHKPTVYQITDGRRTPVEGAYQLFSRRSHTEIRFALAAYDRSRPLTIDPILTYATFLGGAGPDTASDIASDSSGNAYVTGWTESFDFPVTAATQGVLQGGRDAFITKFNSNGSQILYSTYLGGTQLDEGSRIAVDASGNAYVAGRTWSTNFPSTLNAFQRNNAGAAGTDDAFIAKLNPTGGLVYATYLGGSAIDIPGGIAIDNAGSVYVTGLTQSSNFPLRNPFQAVFGGLQDIFIAKLNPAGSDLVYSTFLGGAQSEGGSGIKVDSSGNAYISADTCPTVFGVNLIGPRGGNDIFVAKFNPAGSAILFSTCLGGRDTDVSTGIAVDGFGNSYITGYTRSTDFPTQGPIQANYAGTDGIFGDAFVAKLNPTGASLVYSTFLGGNRDDIANSIAVDINGSAYVTGNTRSSNFPAAGQNPLTLNGSGAFLARINPAGSSLAFSTVFDGMDQLDRASVNVDGKGGIYLAGGAVSNIQFPRVRALPLFAFRGGPRDAFVAKIANANLSFTQTAYTNPVVPSNGTTVLNSRIVNRGPDDADNVTLRGTLPAGFTATSCTSASATCTVNGNILSLSVASLPLAASIDFSVAGAPSGTQGTGTLLPLSLSVRSDTNDFHSVDNDSLQPLLIATNAASCTFSLGAPNPLPALGTDVYSVSVNTAQGCTWGASAAPSWITLTSTPSGTGPGIVIYQFAPNTDSVSRTGVLNIAGQSIRLVQRSAASQQVFDDVPLTHPYFDHISLLRQYAITAGCSSTSFCPDANATRSQIAVFVIRSILGGDDFPYLTTPFFTDVPSTHQHFKFVQKLRELGITQGCGPTTFCPDDQVTRGQMAAFVIRARAGFPLPTFPLPAAPSFTDVPLTHPQAAFIEAMRSAGITVGCSPTQYCPDGLATRGQVGVFIIRAFYTP